MLSKIHFKAKDFHYCLDPCKGKEAFEVEDQKQDEEWRSNRNGDHRDRWRAHLCDEGFLSSI